MKISIVIPTFNSDETIIETIKSIRTQTYKDWECLIMDGGSSEKSIQLLKAAESLDSRVHLYISPDNGVYDAMNKGVKMAQGEYTYFMGTGDRLSSNEILATIIKNAADSPDIIYGYVYFNYGEKLVKYKHKLNTWYTFNFRPVSHQAVFSKTTLLRKDPFDFSYKITADQDWMMRQYKRRVKIEYLDSPIAVYDTSGMSSDKKNAEISKAELDRIINHYYPARGKIYRVIRAISKNKNKILRNTANE